MLREPSTPSTARAASISPPQCRCRQLGHCPPRPAATLDGGDGPGPRAAERRPLQQINQNVILAPAARGLKSSTTPVKQWQSPVALAKRERARRKRDAEVLRARRALQRWALRDAAAAPPAPAAPPAEIPVITLDDSVDIPQITPDRSVETPDVPEVPAAAGPDAPAAAPASGAPATPPFARFLAAPLTPSTGGRYLEMIPLPPGPCPPGTAQPASSGGREPANLTTVSTDGGASTASSSSSSSAVGLVSAIPRVTPVPRGSPTEASTATCPGRQTRTALRRCGADGAAAASTATTGLLSSALSTAAALPTESATADAVFVFKATAEANAAVARGCASADQQAAPSNAKKRAAEEEPVAEPAVHPVLQVTKRARCDVVDVPLTRAIDLLVRSGAKLIYRTSTLRMRPDLADWTMAETPSWTLNHPLRYVPLDRSQGEYRDVAKEFAASCRGKRFTVRRICRVENDRLLYQFQERVRDLERRCGDVAVLRVYHGTLRDNVPSIAIGNLDKRLAGLGTNHFYWGEGVNFSPISYYASHYGDVGQHRSMMVCDVVVGRACSVRQPGKEGPVIPATQLRGCQPGQRYDTNMKLHPGPQVMCKFDDHQFYPAYIVDYTAPARGHRGPKEWEECRPWWYLQSIDLWTHTVASHN